MKTTNAFLAIAIIAMTSTACGKIEQVEYLHSYQIIIDPGFTTDEMNGIIQAGEVWETAVPITFQFSVGTCTDPGASQICISRTFTPGTEIVDGKVEGLNGTTYMFGNRATIYMYPRAAECGSVFFEQVALHELGHSQGLVHHEGCNVMNPIQTECSLTPSADDIAQWYSVPRK